MTLEFPSPLMDSLTYANGESSCQGVYKQSAEDFVVEEQIAYGLSGEGEHLWCWVEKRGENTDWVSHQLAKWANVPTSRIGVAGQKDRHAVTRQWFSIQLPGREDPNPKDLELDTVKIVKMVRHQRKLQTGGLKGNHFQLVIRDINGQCDDIEQRLEAIRSQGVPNYFGEQRFGKYGNNLPKATAFFKGELTRVKRNQKSMYISAARSWMFNLILSERIKQNSWNHFVTGDVVQLEGSSRWFEDDNSTDLAERVEQADLHPTGAMLGRGELPSKGLVLELERQVIEPYAEWITGLDELGLKQDRRALRVMPENVTWEWLDKGSENKSLKVCFALPSGSYATMVLRELMNVRDAQTMVKSDG
ncbi:MAG: tRNA pseudouridine(13) synthase TruD [Pseudomonadota bacterium]|nr:tRNA pseudouridine(13) synthase TruD [Pseudomonadota bacterium]